MKMRFNFSNLFESALDLGSSISRIEVEGIPVVLKQGSVVFDHYSQVFSIPVNSLTPVSGSGTSVPAGTNGTGNSGARSFDSPWLISGETVTFPTASGKPNFESGEVNVRVYGLNGNGAEVTFDVTAAPTTDTPRTGYDRNSSNDPIGDFLLDSDTQARAVSAIYLHEAIVDTSVTQLFGDPRYRPDLLNGRWRRLDLTDNRALSDRLDMVDSNPRLYAVDWCHYFGDRPLVFLRNGPMLSIGELGNVSTCEYPWRTIYLQQPERPANGGGTTTTSQVTTRRLSSLDYTVLDLFRTENRTFRSGSINLNAQQQFGAQQKSLSPLFLGVPVGVEYLNQISVDKIDGDTGSALVSSIADRRIAAGPPPDNNPRRPFFQIGELASVLGRLVSLSNGTNSGSRSVVTYTALNNSANYERDILVEQTFRKVSNSVTTRGNVFRVLYIGQTIKDLNRDGLFSGDQERMAEYLGEAFIERQPSYAPQGSNPDVMKTADSSYKVVANRVITE